jgi:hypothetical protein
VGHRIGLGPFIFLPNCLMSVTPPACFAFVPANFGKRRLVHVWSLFKIGTHFGLSLYLAPLPIHILNGNSTSSSLPSRACLIAFCYYDYDWLEKGPASVGRRSPYVDVSPPSPSLRLTSSPISIWDVMIAHSESLWSRWESNQTLDGFLTLISDYIFHPTLFVYFESNFCKAAVQLVSLMLLFPDQASPKSAVSAAIQLWPSGRAKFDEHVLGEWQTRYTALTHLLFHATRALTLSECGDFENAQTAARSVMRSVVSRDRNLVGLAIIVYRACVQEMTEKQAVPLLLFLGDSYERVPGLPDRDGVEESAGGGGGGANVLDQLFLAEPIREGSIGMKKLVADFLRVVKSQIAAPLEGWIQGKNEVERSQPFVEYQQARGRAKPFALDQLF